VSGYADAIVLRHYEAGAAARAAAVSSVPIINAGDGTGEHPTQALLDLYTLWQHKPNLSGITIGVAGDLFGSRTLHSFLKVIAPYGVKLRLVSPKGYELPSTYLTELQKAGVQYKMSSDLQSQLPDLDVLYINRWQKERYDGDEAATTGPALSFADLRLMKPNCIIMNPLPRISEIDERIDADSRAVYFEQAKNGLYVRMALLSRLFQ
jgi:aspartate carbamoyltransferase